MTDITHKKNISLWMMAVLCAVFLHVALSLGIVYLHAEPEGTIGGPEAIMLEFAEEPQAPDVEEVSETIQQAMVSEDITKDEEDVEKVEQPPEEPVEEKPVVETPKSDMVEEVKKQEEKPKKVEQPKKEQAKPKAEKKKAAQKADNDIKKGEKTQKSSGPQIAAKRGDSFAAPATNRNFGTNGKQVATWKTKVQRRIAFAASRLRVGRSSSGKQAFVTFRFDGRGNITSANLARSSGDGDADAKALQAVQKASPLPAPPEGWSEALTVPVLIK